MKNKDFISDELLAAYLDGNANKAEMLKVLHALQADPDLQEALDIAIELDEDLSCSYNVLPMMKLAAESGDNICSILCEAYVLHRRNIPFEGKELLKIARRNNWLTPNGTPLHSIGQLLAHYRLMVTRRYDASINDIAKALSLDNDVLVVVDSDKLYEGREDLEDAPNHAVVVTDVDGDAIVIFDPQQNSQFSIPKSRFETAWEESQNYMVQVLQTVEDYKPSPINLDNIQLSDGLLELQEAIAENAHEVWAADRMKEGWTYGPVRDDAKKKHPDLIPYSSLPDSEKEYDRRMALETIKLVNKLGFEIYIRSIHSKNN